MTGDPKKFKDEIFPKRMIEFEFKDGSDLDLEHEHIYKIEKKKDGKTQVFINAGDHVHDIVQEILNQGRVSHISVKGPTLEEAFIKHAGGQEETNGRGRRGDETILSHPLRFSYPGLAEKMVLQTELRGHAHVSYSVGQCFRTA
ncbi:MAG: DUF4162 domain-containing protein [Candidatus Saliniplasma sp.]